MTPEEKKQIQLNYRSQIQELNRLIRDWDLIPGSPLDEFGHLANRVLSQLYKLADRDKLEKIIKSELVTTYGFDVSDDEVLNYCDEIFDWWMGKQ